MVVLTAQAPAVGVNVYTVVPSVAVEIVAGDHVPVTPFVEVPGKAAGVSPTQYGPNWVNVGVRIGLQ
jgi:hypothetical protein